MPSRHSSAGTRENNEKLYQNIRCLIATQRIRLAFLTTALDCAYLSAPPSGHIYTQTDPGNCYTEGWTGLGVVAQRKPASMAGYRTLGIQSKGGYVK
jgi:hypothetical protein